MPQKNTGRTAPDKNARRWPGYPPSSILDAVSSILAQLGQQPPANLPAPLMIYVNHVCQGTQLRNSRQNARLGIDS